MRTQLRLLPALLLALAVVLVSVAGSASAAKLITGKQVKNGSLTSVDVRNNNLTGADLEDGTVAGADLKDASVTGTDLKNQSVTQADLAAGAVGVGQLAQGALVVGDSTSYSDIDVSNCPDQTLVVCPALLTKTLSGPQAITVSGTLDIASAGVPTSVRCGILANGTVLSTVRFSPNANGQPGDLVPFSVQTVPDLPAASEVQLRCTQFAADDVRLLDVRLVAISVHQTD